MTEPSVPTVIPSVSQPDDTSEPPESTPATNLGYVDWTLILPQSVEFPDQYLLEIYADGLTIYAGTVSKTDAPLTLRIHGEGVVKLDVYIDTSFYKTETITIY